MKDFEHRLARGGIMLALLLLVAIGVVSYRRAVQEAESAKWVSHTHEVIDALQRVVWGLAQSESSLRGYALTHDARFLEDFEPGLRLAEAGLAAVAELTLDNMQQQRAVLQLRPLLGRRLVQLKASRERSEAGASGTVTSDAQEVGNSIRSIVGEAIVYERAILKDRSWRADGQAVKARSTTLFGVVGSIVLVSGAFLLLDREMRQRRQAENARLLELSRLLQLGELLQACRAPDEALDVISRIAPEFFPNLSGGVSLFHASRNAIDIKTRWGKAPFGSKQVFEPEECWALRRGQLHEGSDAAPAPWCGHLVSPPPRASLCVPLLANSELLGALHLTSSEALAPEVKDRAAVFGEQAAMALANLQLRETLRNQSIRDPLTGLFNRRYSEETLVRELSRAAREQSTLSVLVLDVDHFKRFNDSYGHEAGDEVLKRIALLLQQKTRIGDVATRMGGEELLILLPGAALVDALQRAEQIRAAVEALELRVQGKAMGSVTISTGVAVFPTHGADPTDLIRAADAALYKAKHLGRNRVVAAA
jgi:diguanylate cyclase (GGDEF)-like protein